MFVYLVKFSVLTKKYRKLIHYIRGEITLTRYIKSLFLLYFYNQNFYLLDLDITAFLANFQNVSGYNLPLYTSKSSEWEKQRVKWANKTPFPAQTQSAAEGHFTRSSENACHHYPCLASLLLMFLTLHLLWL